MQKKILLLLILFSASAGWSQKSIQNATIRVLYSPGHPANLLTPSQAFGAGFDGHEDGATDLILQPDNIKAMLSSGYKPLTYRLRSELGNEVWHWNPAGKWSDEKNKQGYWISSDDTATFISMSHTYRLPRRGNTFDQADNDGYSRITDGDEKTYWKSNPYLDEFYSDTKKEMHPQWIVIDLGKEESINAIKINWSQPYATSFTIDYAVPVVYTYLEDMGYYETDDPGIWKPFAHRLFSNQNGNNTLLKLSDALTKARYVRIRMLASSHTAEVGSSDIRDSLGFAIKEVYIGKLDKKNTFTDLLDHQPDNQSQSKVYVSSTDCWHRAIDINKSTEQIGLDRFFQTGLTNNMPALLPVGVLYSDPDNAMALINYVEKKHYPVKGIEMGEEADGQCITPEDYGDLYYQWAKKIRSRYKDLPLGGPSLETIIINWHDELLSTQTWLNRFYKYLAEKNASGNFNFLSFEWYPFDEICDPSPPQMAMASSQLQHAMRDIHESSLPKNIPVYISEYGYSAFSGRSEVDIEGALLNADIVGSFFASGGTTAYLYGLEPSELETNENCSMMGNNMLFGMDEKGNIQYKTATYYGLWMLTHEWVQPGDDPFEVYPTTCDIGSPDHQKITGYALHFADSTWSLLVINKDPKNKYSIKLELDDLSGKKVLPFHFPATTYQYSGNQYQWKVNGSHGHPLRDLPPEKKILKKDELLVVPPYSMTIIKEQIK